MRKKRTTFAALALAFVMAFPQLALGVGNEVIVDLFHLNDVHSRVDNYPAIAGFVDAARATNKNTLFLDAGDTLHGQTIATLEEGESIVKILNECGVDIMTPGNHDFNYGNEKLQTLKNEMNFPLVSCNVYKDGIHFLPSYQIFELEGASIAVIGVTTPSTSYTTHPDNIAGIEFRDPIEEVGKAVADVKGKVDVIVVLAHVGLDSGSGVTTSDIAQAVEGIDLIIDGHSHTKLQNGMQAGSTLIASTGEYAENLGHVTIKIDGDQKTISAELFDMSAINTTDPSKDDYVSPKASVQKTIDDIRAGQHEILAQVVGKTDVLLDGERAHVRVGTTNLANLITDVILDETKADISLHNGGNIRADIPAGDITRGQIIDVLPFGNYIVTKTITGAELIAALENGFSSYPEHVGEFPQFSGIKVTMDGSAPAGQRVKEVLIDDKPLALNEEYILATNDFIAAGGDGYTMFESLPVKGEFSALDEVLIKYIQSGYPIPERADNRLTILNPASEEVEAAPTAPGNLEAPPAVVPAEAAVAAPEATVEPEPVQQAPSQTASVVPIEAETDTYTVQPGDFLTSIAERFGLTWRELYDMNRDVIQDPNYIFVGQVLKVKKAA